ncbi:hypothetical protein Dimus_004922 [Dionaea muscipula]
MLFKRAKHVVNGSPVDEFLLQKELWQRDPLSALDLFLLAAKGLNMLFKLAKRVAVLKEVQWVPSGPNISLLQFADDTPIFAEADSEVAVMFDDFNSAFEALGPLCSSSFVFGGIQRLFGGVFDRFVAFGNGHDPTTMSRTARPCWALEENRRLQPLLTTGRQTKNSKPSPTTTPRAEPITTTRLPTSFLLPHHHRGRTPPLPWTATRQHSSSSFTACPTHHLHRSPPRIRKLTAHHRYLESLLTAVLTSPPALLHPRDRDQRRRDRRRREQHAARLLLRHQERRTAPSIICRPSPPPFITTLTIANREHPSPAALAVADTDEEGSNQPPPEIPTCCGAHPLP